MIEVVDIINVILGRRCYFRCHQCLESYPAVDTRCGILKIDSTARGRLIRNTRYLITNWSSPAVVNRCGILKIDSTARGRLIRSTRYLIINWSFISGRLGQSGGRCLIGHPACHRCGINTGRLTTGRAGCGVGHAGSPEVQRSRQ